MALWSLARAASRARAKGGPLLHVAMLAANTWLTQLPRVAVKRPLQMNRGWSITAVVKPVMVHVTWLLFTWMIVSL